MKSYFLKNAQVVNENSRQHLNILVVDEFISKIYQPDMNPVLPEGCVEIDLSGKFLLPGIIDDQVHFREPGLTQKADLETESRAAVAGGVTAFMDMPNTIPNALTQEILEEKYQIAATKSLANYSFYMGVSNFNAEEAIKTNPKTICGIKIFLGASTGNMRVDNIDTLNQVFAQAPTLVAVHCEDEPTIEINLKKAREQYGDEIPTSAHPDIRSHEACYKSSHFAIELARKHGTRLHVLHLSTAQETELFTNKIPLEQKKITAEVCVHHLWFDRSEYDRQGALVKWNPAIKNREDADALMVALLDDRMDVVATDHSPHQWAEKQETYSKAPSGAPFVQHSLVTMFEMSLNGKIGLEKIVEKMCHNPAILFQIDRRGYIREGYFADLAVLDPQNSWKVTPKNILYKCGWSPVEGQQYRSKVTHTFVNGHLVYCEGKFDETVKGQRLMFNR